MKYGLGSIPNAGETSRATNESNSGVDVKVGSSNNGN